MNFNNFISVTYILCWHIGNFKFAFRYENVEQVACINNRKTVFAEFLSNSICRPKEMCCF
jgi:hypothetical protein